ncbi:MAG: hypothetical protein HFACDABA_02738 [Anaerolineales bacterium]|nr:hypothetical protein [Anaerolineales bacterium]
MVRAEKNSALIGQFVYDANGKQVKTIVDGVTTSYVGNHYEVKDGAVTKYYFAGTTRLAVRHGTTLNYLLSDHLGSSSVTTDENGIQTAQAMYKTFGETRYFIGDLKTDYTFTGQREEASLGLYFFVSRWLDPSLGRFTSPDSIVPTSTQGTQAWDRYAFVNNNPVRYNDPTGHSITGEGDEDGSDNLCSDASADNVGQPLPCTYSPEPPKDITNILPKDDDATQEPALLSPGSENDPDWGKIAAGVALLLLVDLLIVAPIVIGIILTPGVLEVTMLATELGWVIPLVAAIVAVNAYAIDLIVDGAQGK